VGDRPEPGEPRAAFYAARPGGWRDWWTLLHPPYTAWHLAYVVIGACLAPAVNTTRLIATLLAFFFAVGVAAHALDELNDRPLRTQISRGALIGASVAGLTGAVALGVIGVIEVGVALVPFIVIGPILVVAYNFELFGGVIHNTLGFSVSWGVFPVLTAYVAQTGSLALSPVIAALAALFLTAVQRTLSTPARLLRRRAAGVEGRLILHDGGEIPLEREVLLAPLEQALRAMSWGIVVLAAALAVDRIH
jgi:hypothetical protein